MHVPAAASSPSAPGPAPSPRDRATETMKKFASTRSLNKILQQCDSSSREYEEIQAVEKKWHLHLATPRKFLDKKCKMPSLFLSAPPPPKRAPSTTLTLRSKSMTAELEELGKRRRGARACMRRSMTSMRGLGREQAARTASIFLRGA